MALNLITLTHVDGQKVEVAISTIMRIQSAEGKTEITFIDGSKEYFLDPQAKVRDRCNYVGPDGFK